MDHWKTYLKGDTLTWLLEKNQPSVRYFALTDLQDMPLDHPDVVQARRDLMETGPVPAILAKQQPGGWWESPERFYTAKYKGTVWQLLILAEFGADPTDPRIRQACNFILEHSQDPESMGFSYQESKKAGGGLPGGVIPCLTGNMVWSLVSLGFQEDERVQGGISWINKYQRFDDGETSPPGVPPYDRYEMCWGKHTCHLGVVKTLKALAKIPAEKRSPETVDTIKAAVAYLGLHRIHKKSHDSGKVARPGWLRLGFPLMYQTDLLEILDILTKLGIREAWMQEAIDHVVKKQDGNGRWKLENTFNGRFQTDIEQKGQPSKWVSLIALRVLRRYFSPL